MPQGKGTYGSAVGRPPKKEKYQGGGSIDPFSTKNPDSVVTKQALEETKDQADIQTSNAQERNETSPMGAEVGTGVYAVGGMVGKAKMQRDVAKSRGEHEKKVKEKRKAVGSKKTKEAYKKALQESSYKSKPAVSDLAKGLARKVGSGFGETFIGKSGKASKKGKKK